MVLVLNLNQKKGERFTGVGARPLHGGEMHDKCVYLKSASNFGPLWYTLFFSLRKIFVICFPANAFQCHQHLECTCVRLDA